MSALYKCLALTTCTNCYFSSRWFPLPPSKAASIINRSCVRCYFSSARLPLVLSKASTVSWCGLLHLHCIILFLATTTNGRLNLHKEALLSPIIASHTQIQFNIPLIVSRYHEDRQPCGTEIQRCLADSTVSRQSGYFASRKLRASTYVEAWSSFVLPNSSHYASFLFLLGHCLLHSPGQNVNSDQSHLSLTARPRPKRWRMCYRVYKARKR